MKIRNKLLVLILIIVILLIGSMTLGFMFMSEVQSGVSSELIGMMEREVEDLISEESASAYESFGKSIVQKEINVVDETVRYITGRMVLQASVIKQQYEEGVLEDQILSMTDDAWEEFGNISDIQANTYVITSAGEVVTLTGEEINQKVDVTIDPDYQLGVASKGVPVIGKVRTDEKGEEYCNITVSFDDAKGEPAGVLISQISLDVFKLSLASSAVGENGKSFMALDKDNYVFGTGFEGKVADSKEWTGLIDNAFNIKDGGEWVTLNGEEYYALYRQPSSTEWILFVLISKADVDRQSNGIFDEINEMTDDIKDNIGRLRSLYLKLIVMASIILILVTTVVVIRLAANVAKPLERLNVGVKKIRAGNLDVRIEPTTKDEIGDLTIAYNKMTEALKLQMEEIKSMTVAEEKSKAEINLAANVQKGMLPSGRIADDYIRTNGYNKPAKALGGDFYDYFFIDDTHVAIIIADVSDKGIPAALFMTNGRLLLHEAYRDCKDVAGSLIIANDILSRNNENLQFITAFICVIDIATGNVEYVNAGHELPIICRRDGRHEEIKADAGVPLGIVEGYKYKGGKITLDEGDSIFMYTDGVIDCVNTDGEHYGHERMLEALTQSEGDIVDNLLDAINDYSNGADQFDDITMTSFTLKKMKTSV